MKKLCRQARHTSRRSREEQRAASPDTETALMTVSARWMPFSFPRRQEFARLSREAPNTLSRPEVAEGYREGPDGAGGGVPAGGAGTLTGAFGGGGVAAGCHVYVGIEPLATGIWLPLAYMHCM